MQIWSVFFGESAAAQNTSELGIGIGGLSYSGEINPAYRIQSNRPGATIFYKKDISKPVTLGAALTAGMLRANDSVIGLPLHDLRGAVLKGSIWELQGRLEYNFLDYYDRKRVVRWTPYYFIGFAGNMYSNSLQAQAPGLNSKSRKIFGFAIPSGVGIKLALSTHWNLGFEFGARKTFTDELDNLTAESSDNSRRKFLANPYDKDWYYYNGISISYTFYKIHCPDVYKSTPGLLQ